MGRERKETNNLRKDHGAVDKPSSVQNFINVQ